MSPKESPLECHRRIVAAAEATDYVLSRRMLRGLGVTRHQTSRQVRAARWARHGRQTISVRDAPLTPAAARWRAVWEMGEEVALVDGVSALQAAGLKGWQEDSVHVSLLHTHDITRTSGVIAHKVIRRVDDEAMPAGLPRTRPAIAAVRAAHWAVSDKAAATIMAMAVQQRLVTGEQLVDAQGRVRGRTRRAFIRQVVRDIACGAESLGELDFTAALRARGLPEPTRQCLRILARSRAYLDVVFEDYNLVAEIDGAGHLWGLNQTADCLRANEVALGDERVLRINVIGLRLEEDAFMDQIARGLRLGGWHG